MKGGATAPAVDRMQPTITVDPTGDTTLVLPFINKDQGAHDPSLEILDFCGDYITRIQANHPSGMAELTTPANYTV